MSIGYQSDGGTAWCNANNNNAITVPLPGTYTTGDLFIFIGFCRLITASVTTAPSGYTLWDTFTSGTASGGRIWVYYRWATASESPPTFATNGATGTSGDLWGANIYAYSGVSQTGGVPDLDATTPAPTDASGTTTCTYPAITTVTDGARVIRFLFRIRDAADTFTPTASPAHSEREDAGTTTRTGGQHHFQELIATTHGTQAAVTVAPSNTTAARYLAVTMALKPAANVVTGTVAFQANVQVASTPQRAQLRSAAVAATGAVAASPQRALQRGAALAATGQVASSGTKVSIVSRSVAFQASGQIASAGATAAIYTSAAGMLARAYVTLVGVQHERLRSGALAAAGRIAVLGVVLKPGDPQLVRPDADTVTTGWTVVPLYSKVNDESDSTVITAALVNGDNFDSATYDYSTYGS